MTSARAHEGEDPLTVRFFGHASIAVTGRDAGGEMCTVLFDPYEPGGFGGAFAYPPIAPRLSPDLIIVSHAHTDHAHTSPFSPEVPVIGPATLADPPATLRERLELFTLEVAHDAFDGRTRGGTSHLTAITLSGLRVLHSGDIGELPPQHVLSQGPARVPVDVAFIVCGGFYTLGGVEAAELASRLGAAVSVPIHTRTSHCTLSHLDTAEVFEAHFPPAPITAGPFVLTRSTLRAQGPLLRLAPELG